MIKTLRFCLTMLALTVMAFVPAALAQAEIRITDPVVMEGDSGTTTVTFFVVCDPCASVNAIIDWVINDGTATVADNDYIDTSGQLDDVGQGNAPEMYPVMVEVVGDTKFEPDETFELELTSSSVGLPSLDIVESTGVATIQNDDPENQPPVAMCQDVEASADNSCMANVTAGQVDDGSFDPDGDDIDLSLSPAGPYSLGDTPVTLTVTDTSNASDMCAATITVIDDTPPVITLNGPAMVTLECGIESYVEAGAQAADACDPDVDVTIGGDTVDTTVPGTYFVTYDAMDDSGNMAEQVTRTVVVQDTTAPTITLNGEAEIRLECGMDTYDEPGAEADDACDPDVDVVIGGDVVDTDTPGTYIVTYDATDASGNMAMQVTRTVIVEDTTPPEIQCNAPETITPPDAPVSYTATATDACDDSVVPEVLDFDCFFIAPNGKRIDKTESCVVSFAGDTLTIEDSGGVGDQIEWRVSATDDSGNTAMEICSVEVVNPGQMTGHSMSVALFGSGEGFSSDLILQNPSETRTVTGHVRFFDPAGEVLPLTVASTQEAIETGPRASVEFSIPPLGQVTLATPDAGPMVTGSAVVVSDGELGAIARFDIAGIGTTSVRGDEAVGAAIAPVRRGDGMTTGAAVRNVEDFEIQVLFSLRDVQGNEVAHGFAKRPLPPGGSLALLLDQLFPAAATDDFVGELVIRSEHGSFVAIALEIGQRPGDLNALSVTRLLSDQ